MDKKTNKITLWMYMIPALLIVAFVYLYPLIGIFDFSFRRIRGISGPFIGFGNYVSIFTDPIFTKSVINNITLFLIIPIMIILSVIIAVIIYDRIWGWRFYRIAIFMPYVLPITVVGIVFGYIFTLNGVVNEFLKSIGLNFFKIDWLGNPRIALFTIMIVIVWKETGFGIVLFLARLMSVDEELYDSAKIDGASWWGRLVHVSVPQLYPIIEFFTIISMINMLGWVFAYSYTVTYGGPGNATYVMELFIFHKLIRDPSPKPGIAAAASVVLLVVASVLIAIFFRLKAGANLEEKF